MTTGQLENIRKKATAAAAGTSTLDVGGMTQASGEALGTLNLKVERVGDNIASALPFAVGAFSEISDKYRRVLNASGVNYLGCFMEGDSQEAVPGALRLTSDELQGRMAFVYANAANDAVDTIFIGASGISSYVAFLQALAASTMNTQQGGSQPGLKIITPTDAVGQLNQEIRSFSASALGSVKESQIDMGQYFRANQNQANILEADICLKFGFRTGFVSSVQPGEAAYNYYLTFGSISQPKQ